LVQAGAAGRTPPVDLDTDRSARRGKLLLWGSMIVGIFAAGVAFAYKLAEFIFTLNSNSVQGFADVPVTVYFVVAAGWLVLLAWSYVTGKFKDIESSKWDMLRQETEYERRGE
jgi:thiosulfate reductase cytochrome b subunit